MHRLSSLLVVLLSLTPSVAWADIAPTFGEMIEEKASNPLISIPVLVLFILGIIAVLYTMKKRAPSEQESE